MPSTLVHAAYKLWWFSVSFAAATVISVLFLKALDHEAQNHERYYSDAAFRAQGFVIDNTQIAGVK